jgi:hypothetical protein
MRPFAPPEAWLAYQQLLLGGDEPLVPRSDQRSVVLVELHKMSRGNPDTLDKIEVVASIKAWRTVAALVPATDAERLDELKARQP